MHQIDIKIMNESYLFSSYWFWCIFRHIFWCIPVYRCLDQSNLILLSNLEKWGSSILNLYVEVLKFSDIPVYSLASFKRSPFLGGAQKLDIVITAVWMSHLPMEIAHCKDPTRLWYCWIPSSSKNSDVSNSGRSPSGKGDWEVLVMVLFQTFVHNQLSSCL